MRVSLIAISVAVLFTALPICASAQQVIFVVRHGERLDSTSDSVLSAEGEARAIRLSTLLAATGLRTIYATEFKRTQLLAVPTAKRFEITPTVVPVAETETLLSKIRGHAKDEIILVVAHGNMLPAILKGLGYRTDVTIGESDYDNFFVEVPQSAQSSTVTLVRY